MTEQELFYEVIKSPTLQQRLGTTYTQLRNEGYENKSQYQEIEIIKAIINGKAAKKTNETIFDIIKKKIIE